jgi:two-component system, OmpR family, sensor kinase
VPLADAKNIDLGISNSEPAFVLGDPEALRTLMRNLADNAVRYTPSGGRVDVSVEISANVAEPSASHLPTTARHAVLKVIDNGPGIPPEERLRVLDRFYRPPGTSPPGSGLGMAIVKAIADTHGATMDLGSGVDGHGLAVSLSFPSS